MPCILLGRGLIVTALSFALTPVVGAQAWSTKPIRMIVNFAAGGSTDVIARSMSSKLSETLGQQVVVDNRVGVGSAPAGTPREIVTRLHREIGRIMQAADTRSMLTAMAAEAASPVSPQAFAAQQQSARDRFGVLVREAKIRVE
jgi:tripartite-type tricarboxylate transporter receptor subunit TctC